MPPFGSVTRVGIPGSSGRKRSFTELTQSETRSPTPEIPSKRRRRILRSPSISFDNTPSLPVSPVYDPPSPDSFYPESPTFNPRSPNFQPASPSYSPTSPQYNMATPTPPPQPPAPRFVGDGLDFRRPAMATNFVPTIDLTADDEDEIASPGSPLLHSSPDAYLSPPPEQEEGGAPPLRNTEIEIIDVSDEEEEEEDAPYIPRPAQGQTVRVLPTRISSSPEVEFVSERPAPADPGNRPASRHNAPAQALPQPQGDQASLGDMLRRGTQFMFQNFGPAAFNIIRRPGQHPAIGIDPGNAPAEQDNFAGLQFDYQRPAFEMGTRESETPQIATEPYKAPPKAQDGFTRNVEEDEILMCPECQQELASGEGEVQQQVWVIKSCGHVYCGDCAVHRPVKGNRKDARNAKNRRTNGFKVCAIEGCGKSVYSKGSMFQIYL